jgi:DNA-binding Lrp family transcriptional regulator
MISALLTDMKPSTLLVMLSLLLSVFAPSLSSASDDSIQSPGTSQAEFSADDFDWREMVPYLFVAAALTGEQGIKAVLENSRVLRAYVANEVRAECRPDKNPCVAKGDGFMLEGEVSKRIDEIVQEGIFRRHKTAIVDYPLAHQPFPFSEVAALKSEKHRDAYLILEFADHIYTAAQVQAKYGAPYDTNISQRYSVFTYRLDSTRYTSKAVFEIDPVDGAVIKVAISLKPKNRH